MARDKTGLNALGSALLCCMALAFSPARAEDDRPHQGQDVPYVPTPMNVVQAMLDIAQVGPQDFVIDLGSGDGRIILAAARERGARGFGVEIVPALVDEARREARRQSVSGRVEFLAQNLFITEIARATVLTVYLYPNVMHQLRPRVLKELQPGSRVVSHEFDFGNWKPDAHVRVSVPDKPYGPPVSDVYLWIVPADAAGRWQWRMPGEAGEVLWEAELEQTFQTLRGAARAAGRAARVERAELRGNAIRLVVSAALDGREVRHELAGVLAGDTIRGRAWPGASASEADWRAARVERGRMNIEAAVRDERPAASH